MPDDQQQNTSVNSEETNLPASGVSAAQAPADVAPTAAADVPYSGQDLTSPIDGWKPLEPSTAPTNSAASSEAAVPETPAAVEETGGEVPIPPEGVDLPNEGETPTVVAPQEPSVGTGQTGNVDDMATPPVISSSEQPGVDEGAEQ